MPDLAAGYTPEKLSEEVRSVVADRQHQVFVSVAAIWEAAIKARTGKLTLPLNFVPAIRESGFQFLGITEEHALKAADLPAHHKDPFDRMLIAQTIIEDLTLVTRDARLSAYGIPILAA